jgi:hypothetical protein
MLWKEFWNKLPLQNSVSECKRIGYLTVVFTASEALTYIEYFIDFLLINLNIYHSHVHFNSSFYYKFTYVATFSIVTV